MILVPESDRPNQAACLSIDDERFSRIMIYDTLIATDIVFLCIVLWQSGKNTIERISIENIKS